MVVVHRAHGLRFIISIDDHEPAHVHVRGDGEAKVILVGMDDAPEILRVVDMTRAGQRRMMREIRKQQSMLLARWSENPWLLLAMRSLLPPKSGGELRC